MVEKKHFLGSCFNGEVWEMKDFSMGRGGADRQLKSRRRRCRSGCGR